MHTKTLSTSFRGVQLLVQVSPSPSARAPALTLCTDDDGSGTTTLVSIFTALLAQSYVPTTHALELHFYSAEEGGLLGSGEVSRAYAAEGKVVRAMMHMCVHVIPRTDRN